SGSAEFIEKLREAQEAGDTQGLIGQFGVGFYSSFMVADQVTMLTRHAGAEQGVRWQSSGEGSYTLEDVPEAPQGTRSRCIWRPRTRRTSWRSTPRPGRSARSSSATPTSSPGRSGCPPNPESPGNPGSPESPRTRQPT